MCCLRISRVVDLLCLMMMRLVWSSDDVMMRRMMNTDWMSLIDGRGGGCAVGLWMRYESECRGLTDDATGSAHERRENDGRR